ncbi:hypothetical protein MWU54_17090 [Marivita sp. S6314]|uniref:hypothetical protein n=1 Tax=Marivita sp. S6314 TaxID=2926406 RepID=UPI001FF21056|nr:hypothetical protein [Marivita sp. S6314]MCK0151762.1 hypothetical protein [Marivita sp. S6314]
MWYKANATQITHDAETGMFEANVTLEKDGVTTGHVVQVPGPISTPFEALRPALIQAAIGKRHSGRFEFRQENRPSVQEELVDALFSGPSLLDTVLGRAA